MQADEWRWMEPLREKLHRVECIDPVWSQDIARRMRESLRPVLEAAWRPLQEFARLWDEALPPNLRDLEADVVTRALEITAGNGPSLLWVPSAEVVCAVTEEDDYLARAEAVVCHRSVVLTDIDALLSATNPTSPAIAEVAAATATAVSTARAGFDHSAQALAAATLTKVIQHLLRFDRLKDAFQTMSEREAEEAWIAELRLAHLELATANALMNTKHAPRGFNRHGTAHGMPEFFGEAQMLSGLLLLAGWLAELTAASNPR